MRGSFTKINLTGGADAFDVASVRGKIQIRFQNFGFRIVPLQLEGVHDLNKFADRRPGLEMKTQSRQLHRNCRCSGARLAVEQAKSRAEERNRIHSVMSRE